MLHRANKGSKVLSRLNTVIFRGASHALAPALRPYDEGRRRTNLELQRFRLPPPATQSRLKWRASGRVPALDAGGVCADVHCARYRHATARRGRRRCECIVDNASVGQLNLASPGALSRRPSSRHFRITLECIDPLYKIKDSARGLQISCLRGAGRPGRARRLLDNSISSNHISRRVFANLLCTRKKSKSSACRRPASTRSRPPAAAPPAAPSRKCKYRVFVMRSSKLARCYFFVKIY
ncbi:hypothetical protein EVAR_22961_1 [Eumeta japonica]|uniref:Uncharacterized protein n=1 Tax=Eumeta variegata TaxID=151549 RepID=A0A4C1UPY1_EUMVA|nr:hypothetical protein EVAR_22961_1 [Eumeta japonica]